MSLITRTGSTSALLGAMFFLSGMASLGFEVIWSKQLSRVLGGSTAAIAFVVAMFMGGMALGYAAGARWSHRIGSPVRAYGLAEIGLALTATFNAWVFPQLESLGSLWLAYLLAGILLLPCTFLAGLTLPLLVATTRGSVGAALGSLYAINTAGAVCGVLTTGFYLIGAHGLWLSSLLLGGLGLAVGSLATVAGKQVEQQPAPEHVPTAALPTGSATWLAAGAMVGASSLAAQVLWTRILIPHLNSSTYAFSAILAVFLTGLAAGATVAGRLARQARSLAMWLAASQVAAGLFTLFSPELLILSELAVPGYVGVRHVTEVGSWLGTLVRCLGRAGLALLPPTFLMGLAVPLLVALYAPARADRSAIAGVLLGWNTTGAVAGSLLARFALLPALGATLSLQVLALVHAAVALLVVQRGIRGGVWYGLVGALALVSTIRPPAKLFLGRLVESHHVIFVNEGVQDTTAVVEMPAAEGQRQIFSNGIAYAGNSRAAQRYMRLLGHLPALHARQQRRAVVICLGTGMTAAAVLRHRAVRQVDLVDISPVVYRTLPLYADSNDNLLDNARAQIHIEDGRVFLAAAPDGRYDIVSLEPPPPRAAGVSSLYSVEFYQQAQRVMAEGGAVAQWLPIHGMTHRELSMLTRSFLEVFPDGQLIEIDPREAALLATKGPGATPDEMRRRAADPAIVEHLLSARVPDVFALPTVGGSKLRSRIGRGITVTDDRPAIEHFVHGLGRTRGLGTDAAGEAFLDHVLGKARHN